jgi:hypothetical protein
MLYIAANPLSRPTTQHRRSKKQREYERGYLQKQRIAFSGKGETGNADPLQNRYNQLEFYIFGPNLELVARF